MIKERLDDVPEAEFARLGAANRRRVIGDEDIEMTPAAFAPILVTSQRSVSIVGWSVAVVGGAALWSALFSLIG